MISTTSLILTHHLFSYHNDSLEGESPVAMIEEIFKRRTKQINNEDVVQAFLAEVVDIWNTH
jgi:hypothetical protein